MVSRFSFSRCVSCSAVLFLLWGKGLFELSFSYLLDCWGACHGLCCTCSVHSLLVFLLRSVCVIMMYGALGRNRTGGGGCSYMKRSGEFVTWRMGGF